MAKVSGSRSEDSEFNPYIVIPSFGYEYKFLTLFLALILLPNNPHPPPGLRRFVK